MTRGASESITGRLSLGCTHIVWARGGQADFVCLVHTMKIIRFGSFPGGASPLLGHHAAALPPPQHSSAPWGKWGCSCHAPCRDQRAGHHRRAYEEEQRTAAADRQVLQGPVWQGKGGAGVLRWAVETAAARDSLEGSTMMDEFRLV